MSILSRICFQIAFILSLNIITVSMAAAVQSEPAARAKVAPFRITHAGPDNNRSYYAETPVAAYNIINGEYMVVWTALPIAGSDEVDIFGARYNASTGQKIGEDFRIGFQAWRWVSSYAEGYYPDVAYNDQENEYLVVWARDVARLDEFEIWGQRLDAQGRLIGTTGFRISDMGPDGRTQNQARRPRVTYNYEANEYLVVWHGDDNVNGDFEIYGQRLDARGREVGTNDFRISSMGPDGDARYAAKEPAVSYSSWTHQYLVVWTGTDNTQGVVAGEYEIFGQFLNGSDGAPVGPDDFRISRVGPDGDQRYAAKEPDVTYSGSDTEDFLVVWSGTVSLLDAGTEIFGARLRSAEAPEPSPAVISVSGLRLERLQNGAEKPRVVWNGDQREYFVVWDGYGEDCIETFGMRLGPDVTPGSVQLLSHPENHCSSQRPAIVYGWGDNTMLVTWYGSIRNASGWEQEVSGTLLDFPADISVDLNIITERVEIGRLLAARVYVTNAGPHKDNAYITITSENMEILRVHSDDWYCPYLDRSGEADCHTTAPLRKDQVSELVIFGRAGSWGEAKLRAEIHQEDTDPVPPNNIAGVAFWVNFSLPPPPLLVPLDEEDDEQEQEQEQEQGGPDTDNDGVTDAQEELDGSNPHDGGSAVQVVPSTVCSEWNGFLGGMWNIAEQINTTEQELQVEAVMYDMNGAEQSRTSYAIPAGRQFDLLVHELPGWQRDAYGKVCFSAAGAGELDGRMVYYKEAPDSSSFQFAFAMPFGGGVRGRQYVSFNTFQPSLDVNDTEDLVANWIQLSNLENSAQAGNLRFYAQDGSLLGAQHVGLAPGARQDFSGHQFGRNVVGLVEWMPDNAAASFQMRNVRYYYDNPGGENSFAAAFQLEGSAPSGETLAIPLDTTSGSAVIELANTLDSGETVDVTIYDAQGVARFSDRPVLPAHASVHIIADSVLQGGRGVAVVKGRRADSIVSTVMEYGRTRTGALSYLYGIKGRQALGTALRGSFNTFLGQGCQLLLSNPTAHAVNTNTSAVRFDGGRVPVTPLTIPAHGLGVLDICSAQPADVYGTVTVQTEGQNELVAEMIRLGRGDEYRFPTPVKQ